MISRQRIFAFLSFKWVVPLLVILLFLFCMGLGFSVLKARLSADIYHTRLSALAQEYSALVERYNAAVMRSAVTELIVRQGKLSVRIKSAAGIIKTIPVACDPAAEIYVDYIIHDGRLWIRRVFDARTPPDQATLIDPVWGHLDWKDEKLQFGKAVYRQLEDGCWTITVTGNGSLGLVKTDDLKIGEGLVPPPPIEDFHTAVQAAHDEVETLGVKDVLNHFFHRR